MTGEQYKQRCRRTGRSGEQLRLALGLRPGALEKRFRAGKVRNEAAIALLALEIGKTLGGGDRAFQGLTGRQYKRRVERLGMSRAALARILGLNPVGIMRRFDLERVRKEACVALLAVEAVLIVHKFDRTRPLAEP